MRRGEQRHALCSRLSEERAMNGLCRQHTERLRREQGKALIESMRGNANDEKLSPELREQCRAWLKSVEGREVSGEK